MAGAKHEADNSEGKVKGTGSQSQGFLKPELELYGGGAGDEVLWV
jgi:hypothetical protein